MTLRWRLLVQHDSGGCVQHLESTAKVIKRLSRFTTALHGFDQNGVLGVS